MGLNVCALAASLVASQATPAELKKLEIYTSSIDSEFLRDKPDAFRQKCVFFVWNDSAITYTDLAFEISVSFGGRRETVKLGVQPMQLMNSVAKDVLPPRATAYFTVAADFPSSVFYFGRNVKVKIVNAKKVTDFTNLKDPIKMFAWFYKATPTQIETAFKKDPSLMNVRGRIGETPIEMALMQPDPAKVKVLQKLGAKLDFVSSRKQNAMHFAALASPKMIEYVHSQRVAYSKDKNGYNPMFYGVQSWEPTHISALAKAKVPLDEPALKGVTPAMFSANLGYLDVFQELMKVGANRNARDSSGYTVMVYAMHQNVDMFKALAKAYGTVKTREAEGRNLLHVAIQGLHYDIVPFLLKSGISPYNKDAKGSDAWAYADRIDHPVNKSQMLALLEPYRKKGK
ncbi:MAG: ankyrin repeat domain-containing protein [Fimbriimonadaceae bacterium]